MPAEILRLYHTANMKRAAEDWLASHEITEIICTSYSRRQNDNILLIRLLAFVSVRAQADIRTNRTAIKFVVLGGDTTPSAVNFMACLTVRMLCR